MPAIVQVGTILMRDWPLKMQLLGVQSEPYSGTWSVVQVRDGIPLDRKIQRAGWNFFFMAAEVKAMFVGALGTQKIQNALKRILVKVTQEHFNSLEVTGIVAKRFLGVPYAVVSAHSRHVQRSSNLDTAEVERTSQRDAEWARG